MLFRSTPDFKKYAVATISIKEDAVIRDASSHKKEATRILAQNFIEGKHFPGTFTEQQELALREIANGKVAETILGLTPHHSGNAEMQYVPTDLHKAASAEPPPSPAPEGICLKRWMSTGGRLNWSSSNL